MQYQWRKGGPAPKIAAQVFGETVEQIAGPDGSVTPDQIVEAARNKRSPIRDLFEWRDDVAAEAHRRHQALGYLGRLVTVRVNIETGETTSDRAVLVAKPKGGERGYYASDVIAADEELRAQVIAGARRELMSYLNKFGAILAMAPYIPMLHDVLNQMANDIAALEEASKRKVRRRRITPAEIVAGVVAD